MLTDDQIDAYRSLVSDLQEDLLGRVDREDELEDDLRGAWEEAREKDRTADGFTEWVERYTTQVAVGWVLTAIFVRYLEDNDLIESTWLAGVGDGKYQQEDNYGYFVQNNPTASDTDYLLHVFGKMAQLKAGELFGPERNALYRLEITGDAGRRLLKFFQQVNPDTGELVHDFSAPEGANEDEIAGRTRFLGDLYQDLSKDARKRYALLQTPEFVEEFILVETLEPAIETFGLDEVRFIDPTCGSGHFLLGGFRRILRKKEAQRPDAPRAELVREALEATHGVDLNPFAVSIARFRLLIAALYELGRSEKKSGEEPPRRRGRQGKGEESHENGPIPLHQAPELPLHIAVGDSLIQGRFFPRFQTDKTGNQTQLELDRFRWDDRFSTEDADLVYGAAAVNSEQSTVNSERQTASNRRNQPDTSGTSSPKAQSPAPKAARERSETDHPGILMQQYHAVVGNPPYITPKDKAQNQAYREFYASCYYKYSLVCPFYERFFQLAGGERLGDDLFTDAEERWERAEAGYVGFIVGNNFIKRTFGQKLIEEIIPQTDLTRVIDTSGAYIPGHGTPTVIMSGRNREPDADTVRAALGIRGEPSVPDEPSEAKVWSSIRDHIDEPGFENDFVTIDDVDRNLFEEHPWTLEGGGVLEAKKLLESNSPEILEEVQNDLGRTTHTGEDRAFFHTPDVFKRAKIPKTNFTVLIRGEDARDWSLRCHEHTYFPYSKEGQKQESISPEEVRLLWPLKPRLSQRVDYGRTLEERDLDWWDHSMFFPDRFRVPLSITFAEVATHNHFVLDRGGKVFKQTAPVIKLPEEAGEEEHLALLGPLNSSTGCFWMKQVFHAKGGDKLGDGGRRAVESWHDRYQRDGTKMKTFPLPAERPTELPRRLDALGQRLAELRPAALAEDGVPTAERLDEAREESEEILGEMVALQEELDWQFYGIYGLSEEPPLARDYVSRAAELESGKAGELESGKAGELESGKAGELESRKAGELESGKAGELESGKAGELESGKAGELESRKAGELERALDALPEVRLGERAFEIVLARKMEAGDVTTSWFERHGSTPRTDIPERWPEWYRELVAERIERIDSEDDSVRERFVKLIEVPEFKRRWNLDDWEDLEQKALRRWLGDRLETDHYIPQSHLSAADDAAVNSEQSTVNSERQKPANGNGPDARLVKVTELARRAKKDDAFMEVGERYTRDPSFDVEKLVVDLVESNTVPYLPSQRYTDSGVARRREWEQVWELQRREDEIDARTELPEDDPQHLTDGQAEAKKAEIADSLSKPPKYRVKDFEQRKIYDQRGKLDVPKERFTSYPGLETDDGVMRVTWAGLDHLQRAKALATFYYEAKDTEGWDEARLVEILAGIKDLVPWIKQWHNEPDANGTRFGDFLEDMVHQQAAALGVGIDAVERARLA